MRIGTILCAAVLGVFLGGCVPSLHEAYTDKSLTFDPALLGSFSDKDATWVFSKHDDTSYDLLYTDNSAKTGKFVVHLSKSPDATFMDLYPAEQDIPQSDFYKGHLWPVHTFMLVEQVTPDLKVRALNPDWLKQFVKDHPDAIKHEIIHDGDVMLTAEPADLLAFLSANAKTKDAFGDVVELKRRNSGGK